nr:cuticle protein 7-like [Lepeophtheirus salmonis]
MLENGSSNKTIIKTLNLSRTKNSFNPFKSSNQLYLGSPYGDSRAQAPYHSPDSSYKPTKYEEAPQPYAFQYGVADDYTGSNFSAEENADGKITSGSYKVALPDGRIQTVTYTVDAYNGFVADVQYEGTPLYPKYEPKSSPYKPAPTYKYAPADKA